MMALITGTPGSGKTLYAVSLILKLIKEGRTVYANIDGLAIDGVEPAPLDWRTTPDGSVLFYDEAQQHDIFQKTRGTLSSNEIVKGFETHRHTGHDIYFITQSPIFLHTHILELIGEHSHLHRPFGAKYATRYFWRTCQRNPNTKSAKSTVESETSFFYKKSLFKFYKSASLHTHKLNIPFKLIAFFCLIPMIAYGVWHFAQQSSQVKSIVMGSNAVITPTNTQTFKNTEVAKVQQTTSEHKSLLHAAYNPEERVALVIASSTSCHAKNQWGERLALSFEECTYLSNQPWMLSPSRDNYSNPDRSSNNSDNSSNQQAQPVNNSNA